MSTIIMSLNNTVKIIVLAGVLVLGSCKRRTFLNTETADFSRYLKEVYGDSSYYYHKSLILRIHFCGGELCSKDLVSEMKRFSRDTKDRVLVVLSRKDTSLIKILESNKLFSFKIDGEENYLRYGFQRPGHYAFLKHKSGREIQYVNINKDFLRWFAKQ